jgi:2-polyprenyl-3-methyl-5-hydroxy-6-metoxy-1,4-benzoquinol methylase
MDDLQANHYGEHDVAFLERLWGEGYLSPGGPEEVSRIVDGLHLAGATILDIGCGTGGIAVSLVADHGAAKVVGIDVEAALCEQARARVERHQLQDHIEIQLVTPGPFPFDDEQFDVVFSKDSIVHISDKESLCRDAFRVLRPGGWFAASDWLIAHDGEPSAAMRQYIVAEDLDLAMASPQRYSDALGAAGFVDIELRNRNHWYRDVARDELARLQGSQHDEFAAMLGEDVVRAQIATWTAMVPVLDSGEHCPHHFRGRRPA